MEDLKYLYSNRVREFEVQLNRIKSKITRVSLFRILSFLAIFAAVFLYVKSGNLWMLLIALFFAIAFVRLIIYNTKLTGKRKLYRNLATINQNELKALDRDIAAFDAGTEYINKEHPFTYDLDIFGVGSFFQYINRTTTNGGENALAKKLQKPVKEITRIRKIQTAIKEMTGKLHRMQQFMAHGMIYTEKTGERQQLHQWLKQDYMFLGKLKWNFLLMLIPALTISLLLLNILNLVPFIVFLFFVMIQWGIAGLNFTRINQKHQYLSKRADYLKRQKKLLQQIEDETFTSALLKELQSALFSGEQNAGHLIGKFLKRLNAFEFRMNLITGFLLNSLLLWDVFTIRSLEK